MVRQSFHSGRKHPTCGALAWFQRSDCQPFNPASWHTHIRWSCICWLILSNWCQINQCTNHIDTHWHTKRFIKIPGENLMMQEDATNEMMDATATKWWCKNKMNHWDPTGEKRIRKSRNRLSSQFNLGKNWLQSFILGKVVVLWNCPVLLFTEKFTGVSCLDQLSATASTVWRVHSSFGLIRPNWLRAGLKHLVCSLWKSFAATFQLRWVNIGAFFCSLNPEETVESRVLFFWLSVWPDRRRKQLNKCGGVRIFR